MNNKKLEKLRTMSYEELRDLFLKPLYAQEIKFDTERSEAVTKLLNEEPELEYLFYNYKSNQISKASNTRLNGFDKLLNLLTDYIDNGKEPELEKKNDDIREFNKDKEDKDKLPLVKKEYSYSSDTYGFDREIKQAHLRKSEHSKENIDSIIEKSTDPKMLEYTKKINETHEIISNFDLNGTPIEDSNRRRVCNLQYRLKQARQTYFFEISDNIVALKELEEEKIAHEGMDEIDKVNQNLIADNFDDLDIHFNVDIDNLLNDLNISKLDQQIFKMRFKGHKGKEIAKILGWKEPKVSKHYQKVKDKIKASKYLETT